MTDPKESNRTKGPRKRKKRHVWMSLLNIRADPHSAGIDTYRKLWSTAVSKGTTVAFLGDRKAKIASAKENDGVMTGDLWLYTKVGDGGVLNIRQGRLLDDAEFKTIAFDWDAHGFNPHFVPYAFDLHSHRMGFEVKTGQSPRVIAGIVRAILNTADVRKSDSVAHVAVDIEQEEKKLSEILALKLDKLRILVSKPNPDDLADLEGEFRELLETQNAQSQSIELKAEKGAALAPSERTKQIARLALSNGEVEGHGKNPETNRAQTLQTVESPLKVSGYQSLDLEDIGTHLARRTREVVSEIKRRIAGKRG